MVKAARALAKPGCWNCSKSGQLAGGGAGTSDLFQEGQRDMTTPVTFEGIDQAVERARPTIERLASELWQLAELSLQEVKSARLIMDILREEGFTITSRGTARVAMNTGMPNR